MYVPVIASHEYILMALSGGGGNTPGKISRAPILAIEDSCVGDLTEVILSAGVKVCKGEGGQGLCWVGWDGGGAGDGQGLGVEGSA